MSNNKVSERRVKKPTLRITQSRFFSFVRDEVLDVYKQSLKKVKTSFGIAIDEKSIRLVKLQLKEGKVSKLNFDREDLSEISGKDLDKPFEILLKRNKYGGEEIYMHFSSGLDVLNKVIQVDLKPGERLEQWILANRTEVFPSLTEDDIYYDYFVLENGQSKKQLCLSLVRKEVLDSILKTPDKFQLNIKKITAGSFTLCGWFRENGLITDEEQIIVFFKDASAEVLFYEKGLPVFVSEIPVEPSTDDSKLANFLSSFIELLKFYYEGEVNHSDQKILLVGEPSIIENLEQKLHQKGFKSVSTRTSSNPANFNNGSIPPEFVPLYPLVSRSLLTSNTGINLLPLDKRRNDHLSLRIDRIFNFSLKFALISLAILVLLNLGLGLFLSQNQSKVTLFESKMRLVEDLRKENKLVQEKNRRVSNLLTSQSKKAQLLFAISQLLPQGIWLRSLSNESGGENSENMTNGIYLSGLSLSESEVSQVVANLEQSKLFKEIRVAYLDRVSYQDTRGVPSKYRNSLFKFKIEIRSEI